MSNVMFEIFKKLGWSLLAVFAPVQATLFTAFSVVFIDLVTGVIAARKQSIPITSSGLKSTVVKLFVYQAVIALAYITEKYLAPGVSLTNIVTSYIGITELLSINENIALISGNDLLNGLIAKIKVLQK